MAHRCLPLPNSNFTDSVAEYESAEARDGDEDVTVELPDDTSTKPDSKIASSFSKLMAEIGGAWRIFIFMSFTASLFALIYMLFLRFFGGVMVWVSVKGSAHCSETFRNHKTL